MVFDAPNAPQSVVADVGSKAAAAAVATALAGKITAAEATAKANLAQARAQAYTDAKTSSGFNPAAVADLDVWFDADNLIDGVYSYEAFGRADASSLGTSTSGFVWTQPVGSIARSARTAKTSGVNAFAILPAVVVADYAVTLAVKLGPTSESAAIYARHTATNNHIKCVIRRVSGGSDYLQLVSTVAGTETQIGFLSAAGLTLDTTQQVTVEVKGNVYRVYLAKRGVQMPQRILSDTPAPPVLNRPLKGSNIDPKAADLNRPNAWVGLHGSWDWAWMKRSVDRAKSLGANTIRLVGDVETVASGVISQATYLAQLGLLVDYCATQGLD
ncbi:hypothetical protein HQ308_22185 [Rhodococcus sp. BP-241]|uniref:hypothetical protein n=1 Tax=Rhodococcus sp. BP-241 TaxID=2739441 RepID=UPI001C9A8F90|nr:hypothetical protein [Rhodococcus sp. BP-241]MBY6709505.1 hypothetical protein [Rhodococcus sp. BP-241]